MQIRERRYLDPAVASMVAALQGEYRELYGGEGDTTPVDPAEFEPPTGRFFVGYLDGVAVGMGGWRWRTPGPDLPGQHPAEIKRLYVVPSQRGHGLSRTLLKTVEDSARQAGVDWLVLETGHLQLVAIELYRASGYVPVDPAFGHFTVEDGALHLGKDLTR